jgi:3-oxocholest-4-en-26-oyl-CoA dehydrogenase alpha subunit
MFSSDMMWRIDDLRTWLEDVMADARSHADPTDLTGLEESFERRLHREAGARGWLGLEAEDRAAFNFEAARADAPLVDTAATLIGPVLAEHRPDLLARVMAGEVTGCIAYTESAAGSDLTALQAVAHETPNGWELHGTKVLVTGAHKADWCVTVARTDLDAAPRKGMSMFLVDMESPGVRVVRRRTMNGWDLGDIHFDGTPAELLGERNDGWRQMVTAVASERSGMFWLGFARHVLELLVEHVRVHDDDLTRDQLGRLASEWHAADALCRRARRAPDDPVLPSMAKVVTTELLQDLAQTASEIAGTEGVVWSPLFGGGGSGRFAYEYLERVHGTISVGGNEVQRDTIARFGLGMR